MAWTRVDNYRCSDCSGENVVEPSRIGGYITRADARMAGFSRYFMGTPCPKGHVAERWTSGGECCECTKARSGERKSYLANYYSTPANREARRAYAREWIKAKRKTKKGRAENIMRSFMRRMTHESVGKRTESRLGYTKDQFVANIESKFSSGMSWKNHGEWHVDHITPISAFLDEGVYAPSVINALSNLQPLWASDNLSKGAKIINGENG